MKSYIALLLVALLAPFVACGGSDDDGSKPASGGSGGGTVSSLVSALEGDGFDVQNGRFNLLDLSNCCDVGKTCSGNNPTSPYAGVFVPPAPGQTAANAQAEADGMSIAYRLRADEAIVLVGTTPPAARYFGFTPYLIGRAGTAGKRMPIYASLSETLNNGVIAVDGPAGDPFAKPTLVIASADTLVDARIRKALTSAGYPETSINSLVFDPTLSEFGLEDAADTFGIFFRVALFSDAAAGKAFLDAPPISVLRATPKTQENPAPFPAPPARAKDLANSESSLTAAVDALESAIIAANPGYVGAKLVVDENELVPASCIPNLTFCFGDNRDTNYPAMAPRTLFESANDFYVVYGVNHALTGKTAYSSASVYAIEHLAGVASVTSEQYAGSADGYLPGNADAPKLYAWKIARSCGSDPHCLAIPDAACPSGVETGKYGSIVFRTYLEPGTFTAPDPSTLVADRVLRFTQ